MQGAGLLERRQRLIAALAGIEDPSLLDAIERLLDEHHVRARLLPLQDAEVDAMVEDLLEDG